MVVLSTTNEENPALQAGSLNQYISDRLRENSIDIHSAFQLHHEAIRVERFSYRQAAWGHSLSILGIYNIFMHGLTARAFGCIEQARIAEGWFVDDIPFLREKRQHHLADRLEQGKQLFYDSDFLQLLADNRRYLHDQMARGDYGDDEPYQIQVFPFDYAVPEQELLWPGTCPEFDRSILLDSEVENILVKLLTGIWA